MISSKIEREISFSVTNQPQQVTNPYVNTIRILAIKNLIINQFKEIRGGIVFCFVSSCCCYNLDTHSLLQFLQTPIGVSVWELIV